MADDGVLFTLPRKLGLEEREAVIRSGVAPAQAPVRDGSVRLRAVRSLFAAVDERIRAGEWETDRAVSDRWIAPRLHYALRLTRAEASPRGTWQWLSVQVADYVDWRWRDKGGTVAENRWWGEVHKQALSRLWWGGELFRDGADYGPVVRAFIRQDLPNSYLHRPLARCRSLAVAIVNGLAPGDGDIKSSDEVNDLARVLNLATAGCPPEIETGYITDDDAAYRAWASSYASVPETWDQLPEGPPAADTTPASIAGGQMIVARGAGYAGFAAT